MPERERGTLTLRHLVSHVPAHTSDPLATTMPVQLCTCVCAPVDILEDLARMTAEDPVLLRDNMVGNGAQITMPTISYTAPPTL